MDAVDDKQIAQSPTVAAVDPRPISPPVMPTAKAHAITGGTRPGRHRVRS